MSEALTYIIVIAGAIGLLILFKKTIGRLLEKLPIVRHFYRALCFILEVIGIIAVIYILYRLYTMLPIYS